MSSTLSFVLDSFYCSVVILLGTRLISLCYFLYPCLGKSFIEKEKTFEPEYSPFVYALVEWTMEWDYKEKQGRMIA